MQVLKRLKHVMARGKKAIVCNAFPGDEELLKDYLDVVWVKIDGTTEYKALEGIAKALGVKPLGKGTHSSLLKEELVKRVPKRYLALIGLEKMDTEELNSLLYFLIRNNFKLLLFITSNIELYSRVESSFGIITPIDLRFFTKRLFLEKMSHYVGKEKALKVMESCNNDHFLAIHVLNFFKNSGYLNKEVVKHLKLENTIKELNEHQKLLLKAVCEACFNSGKAKSGKVYKLYRDLCLKHDMEPYTERSLLKWLNTFENLGLIKMEKLYGGKEGKTTKLSLNLPVDHVLDVLEPSLQPM